MNTQSRLDKQAYFQALEEAVAYHGHLCSGQAIGVRMAILGTKLLQIDSPRQFRDLITFVECDRCIADAISTYTGCKLGKRRLKWMNYGKTAASFLRIDTMEAWRITRRSRLYPPDGESIADFFASLSDEDLFICQKVYIPLDPGQRPGQPVCVKICEICHEEILDNCHITVDGHVFCKGCHGGHYYQLANEQREEYK